MNPSRDVPNHLIDELALTSQHCMDFMRGVVFLALDSARDTNFSRTHLLSCIADDYLETVLAIPLMAREGIHNACRRELRFLLEMSIKLCFVQQAAETSTVEGKIEMFRRDFDSPKISLMKRVKLSLLPENEKQAFMEHVGRLYGETSNYVHLTVKQLERKLELIDSGRKPGFETIEEIVELNQQIRNNLAASFVFVAHAVPSFAVGNLLVSNDGSSHKWTLSQSKHIALLDEHFDYKHERQDVLSEVKKARWKRVIDA